MKRFPVALLLLLLQVKPLAAAVICLRDASPASECPMPGQAPSPAPAPHGSDHGAPAGCPAAAVCAAAAPALGAFTTSFSTSPLEHLSNTWFVSKLHSADPVAPPAPPPNA